MLFYRLTFSICVFVAFMDVGKVGEAEPELELLVFVSISSFPSSCKHYPQQLEPG